MTINHLEAGAAGGPAVRSARRRCALRAGGAVLSGALLALGHDPFRIAWLVWIALWPLLMALELRPRLRPWAALSIGHLAGAVFFLINLRWLHNVTSVGAVLLALYLAIFPALWAMFMATVGRCDDPASFREVMRSAATGAAAWTGLEWLRSTLLTGFGWNGLGVPLVDSRLAQLADLIGVTGLSFVVVFASVTGFHLMRRAARSGRPAALVRAPELALVAGGMLAAGVYGTWRQRAFEAPPDGTSLRVALVQPNFSQEVKSDQDQLESIAERLSELTDAQLRAGAPDLLVWPESSLPATYYDPYVQTFFEHVLGRGDFALMAGIDEQEMETYFNAVMVARGSLTGAQLYRKVHLVPFGEYLPLRSIFGWFEFIQSQLPGDFDAGTVIEPLPLPGEKMSLIPLICFEDTLGSLTRKFLRGEPQLLVNVTNDAWFRESEGADQHLANARFRCIELRRPMVRAANTGVTCVVNCAGQVTHRLPRLEPGVLAAEITVPAPPPLTVYARFGDAFSLGALGAAIWCLIPVSRRPKNPAPPSGPGRTD